MRRAGTKPSEVVVPKPPEPLRKAMDEGRCVLFAGAGFSVDAGAPTWRGLFEPLVDRGYLEKRNVPPDYIASLRELFDEKAYIDLASALKKQISPFELREHLRGRFSKLAHTPLHEAAVRAGVRGVVTTNYDTLFEQAYHAAHGHLPRVLDHRSAVDLADLARAKDFFVLKIHGTIDQASTVILDRDDYREMIHRNAPVREFFNQLLARDVIVFAGYGLNDPDILLWLDGFRSAFGKETERNYILTATPNIARRDAFLNEYGILPLVYGVETGAQGEERHTGLLRFLDALGKRANAGDPARASDAAPAISVGETSDDDLRRDYLARVADRFKSQQNAGLGGGKDGKAVSIDIAKALVTPTVVREIAQFLGDKEVEEKRKRDGVSEMNRPKMSGEDAAAPADGTLDEKERDRLYKIRSRTTIVDSIPVPRFLLDHPEIVLLGGPGSGKSFLCRVLTLLLAAGDGAAVTMREADRWAEFRAALAGSTPFLYPLRRAVAGGGADRFGGSPVSRILAEWLKGDEQIPHGCTVERFAEFIDGEIARGRGWFIFDGLDETGVQLERSRIVEKIAGFMRNARAGEAGKGNRLLLTSRVDGYPESPYLGLHEVGTIAPFGMGEIERFFLHWPYATGHAAPERTGLRRWADFKEKSAGRPKIFDMATSPILLTILCTVQERGAVLPEQRVKLYAEASQVLFETWEHARAIEAGISADRFRYPRETTRRILGRLALDMTTENLTIVTRDQLERMLKRALADEDLGVAGEVTVGAFLSEIRKQAPVLVEHGTKIRDGKPQETYSFIHKTFQEYLSAVAVLGVEDAVRWIRAHAHDAARYEEIIALAVGEAAHTLNDSARAGALLHAIRQAEGFPREAMRLEGLKMAARCLGEDFPLGKYENHLVELEWRQLRRGMLEPAADHEPVLKELLASRGGCDQLLIRCSAMLGKGRVGGEVLEALAGNLGNDEVFRQVNLALSKKRYLHRESAARSLAVVAANPDVTMMLLVALKDQDYEVRQAAAHALASVAAQPIVTKALLEAAKDRRNDTFMETCNAVAQALAAVAKHPAVTAALLEAVEDEDPLARYAAACALAPVATLPDVTHALLEAVKDDRNDRWPFVRAAATRSLATIASQTAVTAVLLNTFEDTVNDPSGIVRQAAARSLATVASQPAVTAVLLNTFEDTVNDSSGIVRQAAARSLATVASQPNVTEALFRIIHDVRHDPMGRVRQAAARSLSTVASRSSVTTRLITLVERGGNHARWAATIALSTVASQPEVSEALLIALKDRDHDVREEAALALSSVCSNPTIVEAILVALKDEHWSVRKAAATSLASVASRPDVTAALLEAITDENWQVRQAIVQTLASVATQPHVTAALFKVVTSDRDDSVGNARQAAAQALAAVASCPEISKELMKFIKEDGSAGRIVVQALASTAAQPEVTAALLKAVKGQDNDVRQAAIQALASTAAQPEVTAALLDALEDEDDAVRHTAVRSLAAAAAQPAVTAALLAILRNNESTDRRAMTTSQTTTVNRPIAPPSRSVAVKERNLTLRKAAAQVLVSGATPPDIIAILLEAAKSEQWEDRLVAVHALASVASRPEVTAALLKAIRDAEWIVKREAVRSLASVASQPDITAAFISAVTDGDKDVRKTVVQSLATVASQPEVTEVLLLAANDVQWDVRQAAIQSLASVASRPDVTAALLEAITHTHWQVRQAAARSLASVASQPVVTAALFNALTKDHDNDVRQAAERSLESCFATSSTSPEVRETFRQTILAHRHDSPEAERLALRLHQDRFPEREGREILFPVWDDPASSRSFLEVGESSRSLAAATFDAMRARITTEPVPHLSRETPYGADLPHDFPSYRERKRFLRERAEAGLRRSPLAEFLDGRMLIDLFLDLEPILPDTWESPMLSAFATATAGERLLSSFAPDRYTYLEHWARECETGSPVSQGAPASGPSLSDRLRRGWWMAAFLAELGPLVGPFLSTGCREVLSAGELRAFAERLKLDRETSENEARFRAWTALLAPHGADRVAAAAAFRYAWETVTAAGPCEFSRGFNVDERLRPCHDLLGALLAHGAWTNDRWDLRDPEADYPAREVRAALAFQLVGSTSEHPPERGIVYALDRRYVVEAGAWYPALLAICRGINLYGGSCPWEPHPPTVEFRNAAFGNRDEILLESDGAALAFDFRYVTPDGCTLDPEEFDRKADLVERYRWYRFHHTRRVLDRLDVRSPRFPVARLAFHADTAFAKWFDFTPKIRTDASTGIHPDAVAIPPARPVEIASDVRAMRLLDLQGAMRAGNWPAALATLETVEPDLLTRRMEEFLPLLPSLGRIPKTDAAPWYGIAEFTLALIPYAEGEARERLLAAVKMILREPLTGASIPVLDRLRGVYRHLDGDIRRAFIGVAKKFLVKPAPDPAVGKALLAFVPIFFDSLGSGGMSDWDGIARRHERLSRPETADIARWTARRLRELSYL